MTTTETFNRPTKTIAPFSVYERTNIGWKLIDDCVNLGTAFAVRERAMRNAKGKPITVRVYDNRMSSFLNHPSLGDA